MILHQRPNAAFQGENRMSKVLYATAVIAVLAVPAIADTMSNARMMGQMTSDSVTVTDW